jgi:BirA family biotin operon repressor/biotin-[acetyl-CoA-carboxylase] ligase
MPAGTERPAQAFVRDALRGARFGEVTWVAETGSTNDDLAAAARRGAPEQVLVTDLQTAGRGRRGRVWDAPSGSSVLMSILVRGRDIEDGFWSVGAIALAAAETIQGLVEGVTCTLKWPNDVMLGEAKVAGVLAQLADDATIVGIGINVNWPPVLPPEFDGRATAVNHHRPGHAEVDRAGFVIQVLRRAEAHLGSDAASLRSAWTARCSTLGRQVRLELDGDRGAIVGQAVDVDPTGALIIDRNGVVSAHRVGDVVHLRPAEPDGA